MTRNLLCPTCASATTNLSRLDKTLGYRIRKRYGVVKRAFRSTPPNEESSVSYRYEWNEDGSLSADCNYTCDTCSKDLTKGLPAVAVTVWQRSSDWQRSSGFYNKSVAPAWEHEYIEPLDADREENRKKWDALVERCEKVSKRLKLATAL